MPSEPNRARYEAVVMGASAGGIMALKTLLGGLRSDLGLAVLVVLHVGEDASGDMAQLFGESALPVLEAEDGRPIEAGCVYVAPPGYHLLVEHGRHIALSVDERVCFCRPSIDVLFETAAEVYRTALIGVVLTGANEDGAAGLACIRSFGGLALVQDPDEAEIATMPLAALTKAGADQVLRLDGLTNQINSV